MILYHYYRDGTEPFLSLSLMPDDDAITAMTRIYGERGDTVLDGRFREPEKYLGYRRRTETWLREEFESLGGKPLDPYPTYFTVGRSEWLLDNLDSTYHEVEIPIEALSSTEVCFTFPDSMTSWGYGMLKPDDVYIPELHGKVFTLEDATKLLMMADTSADRTTYYEGNAVTQYIEAQVWNSAKLKQLLASLECGVQRRVIKGTT